MNRILFIKPEVESFTNSQYKEIINGKPIHDANIRSYRKNGNILIKGNIDNKPIYYDSRQPFRNKVSFANPVPIKRELTPYYKRVSRKKNKLDKAHKMKRKTQKSQKSQKTQKSQKK